MHFTLDQVLTLEKIRERERESQVELVSLQLFLIPYYSIFLLFCLTFSRPYMPHRHFKVLGGITAVMPLHYCSLCGWNAMKNCFHLKVNTFCLLIVYFLTLFLDIVTLQQNFLSQNV